MGSWTQCCCVSSTSRLDKNKNIEEFTEELKKLDTILEQLDSNEAYIYSKLIELDIHKLDCMQIDAIVKHNIIQVRFNGSTQDFNFRDTKQIVISDSTMTNILVDMEVLNQQSPLSSDIWTHFFLLLKSEERTENDDVKSQRQNRKFIENTYSKGISNSKKRQKHLLNQTVNYNDAGRLSQIFSSDSETNPVNETFIAPKSNLNDY